MSGISLEKVADLQQEWRSLKAKLDSLIDEAWNDLTQDAITERTFAIRSVRSRINELARIVEYAEADESVATREP